MGDLPGGAILVQASEGKDVVLRQGGRILRTLSIGFYIWLVEQM